jgi:hypothetical protein
VIYIFTNKLTIYKWSTISLSHHHTTQCSPQAKEKPG